MTAHARLSPSGASRWTRCPGSVRLTAGLPRRSSEFAAEGTVMHEIASECLEWGMEPTDYVGQHLSADGHTFEITSERAGWLDRGLDFLRDQPGRMWVEQRVHLEPWLPGQFGTMDCGLWDAASGLATVFDWKFGAGVPVAAVENEQLRIYALGFYGTFLKPIDLKPDRFRIVIEQPRALGGGGEWSCSFDELMAFGDYIREAGRRTLDADAPIVAGDKQCRFCEAKDLPGGCSAHTALMLDIFSQKFDDLDENAAMCAPPLLPQTITPERRSYIVQHSDMVTKWFAKLAGDTLDDAIAGRPTPGLKAVAGRRGSRRWRDAEQAEGALVGILRDQAFTKQLKSPAQAEKDMPAADFKSKLAGMVTQDNGKPCLVPDSDPRPALQAVDDKFDEEPETT